MQKAGEHQQWKRNDINKIDYDDKAVLDSIGTGKTDGVFQLESAGMKNFMKELKPQSLEDIIAGISCIVRADGLYPAVYQRQE